MKPFLEGELYVVGFKDTDGTKKENYVFIKNGSLHIYRYSYELFHGISKESEPAFKFQSIVSTYGIEGTIALILTLTISYLAIRGLAIPEILGSALTAILGFYFGSKINNK